MFTFKKFVFINKKIEIKKKFSFPLKQCKPVNIIFKYITVFYPSEDGHFIDLK